MNKEAKAKEKEVGTLLTMLQLLGKLGVTDSMLQRKHGLNRASLNTVRKGGELRNAHGYYFKTLLGELECHRQRCRKRMDADGHRRIKEVMFDVMLREELG